MGLKGNFIIAVLNKNAFKSDVYRPNIDSIPVETPRKFGGTPPKKTPPKIWRNPPKRHPPKIWRKTGPPPTQKDTLPPKNLEEPPQKRPPKN